MATVDTTDPAYIQLLADVAALKGTVNTASTGLVDRVVALEEDSEAIDESALEARVVALEKKQIDSPVEQTGSSKFTGESATLTAAAGDVPAYHFSKSGSPTRYFLFNSVAVVKQDGTKITAKAAQSDATTKAWLISSNSGQITEVLGS